MVFLFHSCPSTYPWLVRNVWPLLHHTSNCWLDHLQRRELHQFGGQGPRSICRKLVATWITTSYQLIDRTTLLTLHWALHRATYGIWATRLIFSLWRGGGMGTTKGWDCLQVQLWAQTRKASKKAGLRRQLALASLPLVKTSKPWSMCLFTRCLCGWYCKGQ